MPGRDVAPIFLRWTATRSALHRGYWLVASLYLVVDADLTPFQLIFLGTAQGLTALVFEIPAGVLADTISRKWSIVTSHVLMGLSMVATGLVTAFPALVATQMLWGLSWTFTSGADVAWVTDEMDRPERTARVLTAAARWDAIGAAAGMLGFGAMAWSTDRSTAMIVAGLAMAGLGLHVVIRFIESRFTPTETRRWRASMTVFERGVGLAARDRQILLVLAATFLVNGAAEGFGRLFPKRLVDLGLPADPDPIVWFTALGIATLAVGVLGLRIVEARIEGAGVARSAYAMACAAGTVGLVVLAHAPDDTAGMAGVLIVGGLAMPVTRAVGVIWVNRRSTSEVRATLQSFLAQLEYLGEIVCGFGLALIAQASSVTAALSGSAVLMALAGALILQAPGRRPVSWASPKVAP